MKNKNPLIDTLAEKNILKNKRKKAISNLPIFGKVAVYLGIYKIWYEKRDMRNTYFECNKINIYNPILWVVFIVLIPYALVKGIFDLYKDIIKMGNTTRWG